MPLFKTGTSKQEGVILVIGESGTGKSTLCNILAGEPHSSDLFPASPDPDGRTHHTSIKTQLLYRGNKERPITIIDTQGFNDPGKIGAGETQKNHEIIHELLQKLITIRHVNLFVICLNGMNFRIHESLVYMIKLFRDIFGQKMENNEVVKDENVFWNRCAVVYTHMGMDETAVRKRLDAQRGDSDGVIILKNLRQMKSHFGIGDQISVQYAIIDALYKNSQGESSPEQIKFEGQCEKLYNCFSEKLEKTPAMVEAMIEAYNKIQTCK